MIITILYCVCVVIPVILAVVLSILQLKQYRDKEDRIHIRVRRNNEVAEFRQSLIAKCRQENAFYSIYTSLPEYNEMMNDGKPLVVESYLPKDILYKYFPEKKSERLKNMIDTLED